MPVVHRFNVYGYRFSLRSLEPELVEGLCQDFAYFASEITGGITVDLVRCEPPRDDLPRTDAVLYTPRNLVYRGGGKRFIDYHGRALGIHDPSAGSFKIYSRDADLLYEATYLFLLAEIGKYLDGCGTHRIHALGVALANRAVLVLLPMGGGKSTLGLHLLKHPGIKLLSDDSPFLDSSGRALAYPLRLGLLPGSENAIPAKHRRLINRMEFGPKHLVNYEYFEDRVQPSAEPGLVFVGARTLDSTCRIEEIGRMAGLRACIANCVVGVGLFQGVEFILEASAWELFKKIGLGASRLRNCWQLLRRSRVCRIHLGRDPELNARTLIEYAAEYFGDRGIRMPVDRERLAARSAAGD